MRTIFIYFFVTINTSSFAQQNLDGIFKKASIAGVQIESTKNDRKQSYFYGISGAEDNSKINASSVFQAASLSKVVLAYITMRMVDKKVIALDTPLYNYYQYARIKNDSPAKIITARMVLHHLSGFPNWAVNPTSKEWATSELKTKNNPGSIWSYSGEGFMFLQLAIEYLSHKSLEEIAVKEVFTPLKMESSSFLWNSSFENTAAYGHNKNGELTGRTEYFLPGGAYSLLTTAHDYNNFLQALMTGTGLTKQTYNLMLNDTTGIYSKNNSSEAAKHIFWGLGIGIQENETGKAIWHWGDNGDFKCFFMAFPGKKESFAYFTNSENGLTVLPELLNYFFGNYTWWASTWLKED